MRSKNIVTTKRLSSTVKRKWVIRLSIISIIIVFILEIQGVFNIPKYPTIGMTSEWFDTAIKTQASLKDVRVPTSHNSYLWGAQHASMASVSNVLACLRLGARCIELDVYRKALGPDPLTPSDPSIIVAHGTEWKQGNFLTTTSVSFESCIAALANYPTEDPIFLCLEMRCNDDEVACNRVADILARYLGSRWARRRLETEWPDVKMESLKGKVVAMSAERGVVGMKLLNTIHLYWGSIIKNINASKGPKAVVTPLCRVYPDASLRGIFSFNYDPEPFYKAGAQFVALNYQKL